MKYIYLFLIFCILSFGLAAQDTFSIVAVDSVTGEVGSAGASCLQAPNPPTGCLIISDVIPGLGAIYTQAQWDPNNQAYAHQMLVDEHRTPQAVIDQLINDDAANNPGIRQYGIAAFDSAGRPKTAAYTGAACLDYKNHILGTCYSIQGNILLGQQILDSIESRFLHTNGTLSDKLMAALQGANLPGADTRCIAEGVPSQSSFIRVAKPTDSDTSLYLNLVVKSRPYGMSPVDSLQTLYDEWKANLASALNNVSDNEIKIYPNPASSVCSIQFATGKDRRVAVFDTLGNLVFERKCFAYCRLPVAEWQRGAYFVHTDSTVEKLYVE